MRGVFLDIFKAFDKVWHEGLVYKLKQNGISGKHLNVNIDFLSNRKQQSCSKWKIFFMDKNVLHGTLFLKVQYWDHYFFSYTLMSYLVA